MGIVQKDAFRTMVISYIGILLGYINKGFLFLIILTTAQIGLVNLLVTVGTLFAQFANLGTIYTTWKFFPYFKNEEKKHHGFLPFILSIVWVGIIVCTILFVLFRQEVQALYAEHSAAFSDYYFMVLPIGIATVLYLVVEMFLRALYKNTLAVFALEIGLRLSLSVLLGLLYFKLIDFNLFVILQSLSYLIPLTIVSIYLIQLGEFNLSWRTVDISKRFQKIIRNFSVFTYINTLGIVFVNSLDIMMIAYYLGLEATGVYTTVVFLASALQVPYKSVIRVSSPLVADHWKRREMDKMQDLYTKVSSVALVIGLAPFLAIWANIDFLFGFLKPEFLPGIWVFFFLMMGRLLDMYFGINGSIFVTSKKYKFDIVFTLVLMGTVVVLNTFFIPWWGIAGAAISTSIALIVYNLGRLTFVWTAYNIHPFSLNQLKVIALAVLTFVLGYVLPEWISDRGIVLFIAQLTVVLVFFILPILTLRLDPEISGYVKKLTQRFLKVD
jgi:O-antigen/teichoic acid export membrane protein